MFFVGTPAFSSPSPVRTVVVSSLSDSVVTAPAYIVLLIIAITYWLEQWKHCFSQVTLPSAAKTFQKKTMPEPGIRSAKNFQQVLNLALYMKAPQLNFEFFQRLKRRDQAIRTARRIARGVRVAKACKRCKLGRVKVRWHLASCFGKLHPSQFSSRLSKQDPTFRRFT